MWFQQQKTLSSLKPTCPTHLLRPHLPNKGFTSTWTKPFLIGGLVTNSEILFLPVWTSRCGHPGAFCYAGTPRVPPSLGKTCWCYPLQDWPFHNNTWTLSLFRCDQCSSCPFSQTGWQLCNCFLWRTHLQYSSRPHWWWTTIPVKRMGLLDLYNGLNIIQTCDYIKIACSTFIEKILENTYWRGWSRSTFWLAVQPPSTQSEVLHENVHEC